jgi:hypothetical protein
MICSFGQYDEENVRDNQIDDDMLMDDDDDAYGKPHPDHQGYQVTIRVQTPEESSVSRVEAAFGLAMPDNSDARVEAAFAEVFRATTTSVSTAPAAVTTIAEAYVTTPAISESPAAAAVASVDPVATASLFPTTPQATVVPILAPPSARPTRSLGSPLHSVSSPTAAAAAEALDSSAAEAPSTNGYAKEVHSEGAGDAMKHASAVPLTNESEESSNGHAQSVCICAEKEGKELDEKSHSSGRNGYSEVNDVQACHAEDAGKDCRGDDAAMTSGKNSSNSGVQVQSGDQKTFE